MTDYFTLKEECHSIFGQGSKLKGDFFLTGPTHISSIIEGNLTIEDDADICIESVGQFIGTIKCHNIKIYGKFQGTIKASGKVTAYPTATLSGTLFAKDFTFHPGSTINVDGQTYNE